MDQMLLGFEAAAAGFIRQVPADDHAAEVIPTRKDDLHDMDEEEEKITDGQDKVDEAGAAVTAEEHGEPGELCGLVDRETRQNGANAHDDDGGIRDLLRRIIFALHGRVAAQM